MISNKLNSKINFMAAILKNLSSKYNSIQLRPYKILYNPMVSYWRSSSLKIETDSHYDILKSYFCIFIPHYKLINMVFRYFSNKDNRILWDIEKIFRVCSWVRWKVITKGELVGCLEDQTVAQMTNGVWNADTVLSGLDLTVFISFYISRNSCKATTGDSVDSQQVSRRLSLISQSKNVW